MGIDLTELLGVAGGYVEDLITTSGTTGSLRRNANRKTDAATDKATLARTDPTPAQTVATGLAALVIPQGLARQTEAGPALTSGLDTYTVLLLPDVLDVRAGDLWTTDESLDGRLVGRTFLVDRVADGTAGVVRTLYCTAAPASAGA